MRLIESRNYDNLPVIPRKCLEVPVIVACSPLNGQHIHCYFPREDRWYSLGEMQLSFEGSYLVSCHGKIYGIHNTSPYHRCRIVLFNPYTRNWMLLPCKEDRDLNQIFVANEDEMYAFVSEPSKDNFIYFIGGTEWRGTRYTFLTDVERSSATGAAANGKIFIAGGDANLTGCCPEKWQCEVFIETTNEWQFIPTFGLHPKSRPKLVSVDDRLYVLAKWANIYAISKSDQYQKNVKCYDPDKNKWNQKTKIPAKMRSAFNSCSMRIFKGFLYNEGEEEGTRDSTSPSARSARVLSSSPLKEN
ncbi:hypothetical protein ACROYT_G038608 [Oculina patagonica]